MKVWLVWMHDYNNTADGTEYFDSLVAVYSTEEKAKAAVLSNEWIVEEEVK